MKKERTYNNARGYILRNLDKYGYGEAIEDGIRRYHLRKDEVKDLIPSLHKAIKKDYYLNLMYGDQIMDSDLEYFMNMA